MRLVSHSPLVHYARFKVGYLPNPADVLALSGWVEEATRKGNQFELEFATNLVQL